MLLVVGGEDLNRMGATMSAKNDLRWHWRLTVGLAAVGLAASGCTAQGPAGLEACGGVVCEAGEVLDKLCQ